MVFTGFRVAAEVFRAKIRSQHAVWMHSAVVDALFRRKIADGETRSVMKQYMGQLQTQSKRSSLADVNRRGRGRVHFTSIAFEDEHGNAIECGVAGQPLTVILNYQSEKSQTITYPYRIAVAFYDMMGRVLFNCATEVASTETTDLPPAGSVRCVIPKLPLTQSEYPMTLFLEVNVEIEDWIEGEKTLQVLDGDFFNTGKVYPEGWQGRGVLVPHYWVLKNQ
jgi:lipopolysaccharide transport system ATP-binding protein